MKIIQLIFSRLHGYLIENKFITIIYIIGFMLSVLAFTFVYNNFMPSVVRLAKDDSDDHYYSFSFSEQIEDISWLRNLLKNYDTYYVKYEHLSSGGQEIEPGVWVNVSDSDEPDTSEDILRSVIAYKNDDIVCTPSGGRLEFTDEERKGESYVAILPANNSKLGALASEYTHEGNTYKAVGWYVGGNAMIIPEELFVKSGFSIKGVTIYTSKILSTSKRRELVQAITEKYNVRTIYSPASIDDIYKENTKPIIFMLTAGFMVMVFVFGYLIRYLVLAGKNESVIYRLTGAGNGEVIALALLENLIVNVVLAVLSVVIHAVLFEPVFRRLNFYDVKLSIYDYLIIIGITTVFSFAAVFPHVVKSVRSTLISSRNQI